MSTAVTGSVLVPVALFLFVYNATPEALPYESYVMTAFPHLTTWQLGLRSFLTSLGSLVGVLLYWRLFSQVRLYTHGPSTPPSQATATSGEHVCRQGTCSRTEAARLAHWEV